MTPFLRNAFLRLFTLSAALCLVAALAACPKKDEPVQPTPVPEPVLEKDGDVIVQEGVDEPRSAVELPVELVVGEVLLEASDPALLENLLAAAQRAEQPGSDNDYTFSVYLALAPGALESPLVLTFNVESPDYAELLSTPVSEPAEDGIYSAVGLVFIDSFETCSIISTPEVSAEIVDEHKGKSLSGGCCAVLAVAHSLVRKMGTLVYPEDAIIDVNGDGIFGNDGDKWKPDFLKKVRKASGDTDNGKGMTDGEAEKAHEADWNDAWKAKQVDDDVELFDNGNLSCSDLKERCDKLIGRLKTNDDITMRIRGKDGKKGKEWGHRVPVEGASYTAGPPCCCTIDMTETSRQEPTGSPDFTDIPANPGTASYSICTDAAGKTTVTNTEFPGSTITKLGYDSFDEEARNSGVKSDTRGNKGSAFDD